MEEWWEVDRHRVAKRKCKAIKYNVPTNFIDFLEFNRLLLLRTFARTQSSLLVELTHRLHKLRQPKNFFVEKVSSPLQACHRVVHVTTLKKFLTEKISKTSAPTIKIIFYVCSHIPTYYNFGKEKNPKNFIRSILSFS